MKNHLTGFVLVLALVLAPRLPAQHRLADFRRVVVPEPASEIQKVAAGELATYAGKVAGTKLEVVPLSKYAESGEGLSFFVGDAVAEKVLGRKPAPWKQEEWMLKSVPKGIVLAGDEGPGDPWSTATRAGTLLATYTLLDEHLGVKWLWPGPFGEHVPSNPQAVVPALDLRATPKFFIRSIQFGYPRFQTAAFRDESQKWARRLRLGWTTSATFGHSWYYAFDLKSPKSTEKLLKEHSEWFALVNGKRQPPHMCTTHPAVRQTMVDYVLKSKYDICHISPSDGYGFCECNEQTKSETHKKLGIPSCASHDVPGHLTYDGKSLVLSDRIFDYANDVARRVREKNPSKSVGMFAYTYYVEPPIKLDHIEPNLYLSFCYQSMAFRDPQALAEWHASVDGWKKFGVKMVVREGWGAHYILDLPFMNYDQTLANLAEAYKLGFVAGYGEGTKSFATQAPNQWAIARALWDPERDAAKTMDDYFQSAYGPVAAEMRAYFETWNQALNENWSKRRKVMDTSGLTYKNVITSWHLLLPPSVIEKAEVHLKAAEAKAPKGEYADRVAFHRFGHEYSKVVLAVVECYRQLAEFGVELEFFVPEGALRKDDAEKQRLLKKAYELGELREKMLLEHRDWAGPDEGLYAQTNDAKVRLWHAEVKRQLGIDKPSALTLSTLQPAPVAPPKK